MTINHNQGNTHNRPTVNESNASVPGRKSKNNNPTGKNQYTSNRDSGRESDSK